MLNAREAKNFSKSLASFALVPTTHHCPLTSDVMVVNKDGDLELYALHDTPTHTPWSSRGDLAMGVGRSYRIIPGFCSRGTPPEPWDVVQASVPPSAAHSVERFPVRDKSLNRSGNNSPPTFGRGDEDGFPALVTPALKSAPANLAATRPGSRSHTPPAPKELNFDHVTAKPDIAERLHFGSGGSRTRHPHARRSRETSTKRLEPTEALHKIVECDISMIMRHRVVRGYSLVNVGLSNPHVPDFPHARQSRCTILQ